MHEEMRRIQLLKVRLKNVLMAAGARGEYMTEHRILNIIQDSMLQEISHEEFRIAINDLNDDRDVSCALVCTTSGCGDGFMIKGQSKQSD